MTEQKNKTLDELLGEEIESYKLEKSCTGGYCDLLTIKFKSGRKLMIQSIGEDESEL